MPSPDGQWPNAPGCLSVSLRILSMGNTFRDGRSSVSAFYSSVHVAARKNCVSTCVLEITVLNTVKPLKTLGYHQQRVSFDNRPQKEQGLISVESKIVFWKQLHNGCAVSSVQVSFATHAQQVWRCCDFVNYQ